MTTANTRQTDSPFNPRPAPFSRLGPPAPTFSTWFKNARFWVTLGIRTWNVVRLDL